MPVIRVMEPAIPFWQQLQLGVPLNLFMDAAKRLMGRIVRLWKEPQTKYRTTGWLISALMPF